MHAHSSPSPAATTIVTSGSAAELAPAMVHAFPGGLLRVSHVAINDHIDYAQCSGRYLLHATLSGSASRSAGRIGKSDGVEAPDRRGSVSFTPEHRERRCSVGRGEILGFELGFDAGFVEDACEQLLRSAWRDAFNTDDAKAFAIAETITAALSRRTHDRLALDLLLLALARHVGRAYAKADRRSDDGWLHPAALARVVERLRTEPARPFPLHEMARTAGLGVSAFVRAFRGSVGMTPAAFAMQARLDHAAELLRATDLPAADIAAISGFASASHLARAFRLHRGVTPGRWRREADPAES